MQKYKEWKIRICDHCEVPAAAFSEEILNKKISIHQNKFTFLTEACKIWTTKEVTKLYPAVILHKMT